MTDQTPRAQAPGLSRGEDINDQTVDRGEVVRFVDSHGQATTQMIGDAFQMAYNDARDLCAAMRETGDLHLGYRGFRTTRARPGL